MEKQQVNQKKKRIEEFIVETASEIFRKFGFKKTTIDDIAAAAHKGKSSLYYYFSSKEDIFNAVVNKEARNLKEELEKVINDSSLSPKEKLMQYIVVRMERVKELVNYYEALKSEYLSHYDFIDQIRQKHDEWEIESIQKILNEGVSKGSFDVEDTYLTAMGIVVAMKGLEIPLFLKQQISDSEEKIKHLLNILFYGICKK